MDAFGADERTRTVDLLITNQLLYQLSYAGRKMECAWILFLSCKIKKKIDWKTYSKP